MMLNVHVIQVPRIWQTEKFPYASGLHYKKYDNTWFHFSIYKQFSLQLFTLMLLRRNQGVMRTQWYLFTIFYPFSPLKKVSLIESRRKKERTYDFDDLITQNLI